MEPPIGALYIQYSQKWSKLVKNGHFCVSPVFLALENFGGVARATPPKFSSAGKTGETQK